MRKRMLNPDFFTDPDIVASLDAYGRLLYQGIWCVAEDSGCFELNPLLLKMKILPGDQSVTTDDIEGYLEILIVQKKIISYEVDGKSYGWLKNFDKHQSLNKPNAPAVPLPKWITFHGEEEYGSDRHKYYYEIDFGYLKEEKSNPVDNHGLDSGKTMDRQRKDKDSHSLENSWPEEKRKEEKRKEKKGREEKGKKGEAHPSPIPYQDIANLYNKKCSDMTKVIKISDNRKKHLKARWQDAYDLVLKEKDELSGYKLKNELFLVFDKLFQKTADSSFMNGENDRDWKADFDWLIKNNNNFTKVLEGKYDNKDSVSENKKKSKGLDIDELEKNGWNDDFEDTG